MTQYWGKDRRGVNRTGATEQPALKLAEDFYRRRWHWAEIKNEADEVVGEVGPGPNGYGWWADSSA